jgi:hypothetical protein
MPKLLLNDRLSVSVLKARAGLIPASDDIEDELDARTACIGRAVKAYAKWECGQDDLAITEILQDLRHYCDRKSLVFDELDAAARAHHLEYVNDSPWIERPSES